MFDNSVKFKYNWRPYQERTLKQVEKYIDDGKVHIVAAPGAGKTVLGLELVRYLKNPVIIFAPTVTIKNQWIDRFVSLFTDFKETPDWISTNIYDIKFFNVVTYQALHYAYKKRKIKDEVDDDTDDVIEDIQKTELSSEDIKQYDIVEELRNKKITTIVLDEAHHLKSQWWDSLKKVVDELKDSTIISLTATPPYDSEFSEWKKYTSLCGEIDSEITVPELVKANNLCPHQDYIYFNSPTEEEQIKINEYEKDLKIVIENIKNNEAFVEAIKSHKYIISPYDYQEELLENVEYYSSMVIFLNSKNIKLQKDNLSILGDVSKIPELDTNWLEILLKNVIITDRKNYTNHEEAVSEIETELNKIGVIEKSNLSFSDNKTLQKYFLNSIGKLNSISEILKIEKNSLKENLRMVILTDYIRKEYLEDKNMDINKLGVIPIFSKLTKDFPDVNMAILTGSLFVIPRQREENLYGLCEAHGVDTKKLNFKELSINQNYSIVEVPNNLRNKVMSLICKLFSNGLINVIIGTKSLLGEGWDEPSINTLVLASFVGSFMLSNQMRGRAIRVNKDPNKAANIWHLVCVTDNVDSDSVSNADFEMLKRRFTSFVGLNYNNSSIESGIDRLGNVSEPFTKEKILSLNSQMETKSADRVSMLNAWKTALDKTSSSNEMTNKIEVEQTEKMKSTWFINKNLVIVASIFFLILFLAIFKFIKLPFIIKLIELGLGIYVGFKLYKMYKFSKSDTMIKEVGSVVLNSLYRCKFISTPRSKVKLNVKKDDKGHVSCYLTGATLKESNLFIDSLEEVFSKTINQRYIIAKLSKNLKQINEYYNVPTVLSTNKETAEVFSKYWSQKIGEHDLVYTRTADGRRLLLKARMKDISYTDKILKKQEFTSFK